MVAVGKAGTVLLSGGSQWNLLLSGTRHDLTTVRGDRWGRVFVAGEGGTLLELVWP